MDCSELNDWIKDKWQTTIRTVTKDEGNLIGLPLPFAVPCTKGHFQEMYYWDTYFASRGLALHGMSDMILNHCENFFFEIEKFGFIPNGSRTYYLSRSQPPYLGATIQLACEYCNPDKQWLEKAAGYLERELDFWETRRSLPNGLHHFGHHANEEELEDFYSCCMNRIGMSADEPRAYKLEQSAHTMAEAESGWDFNPRFDRRCLDFTAIDLDSLLYFDEVLLSDLFRELDQSEKSSHWSEKVQTHKQLINKYCWDDSRGVFLDYDSKNDSLSSVFSAASLQPLWVGLATKEQAASTVEAMEKYLEADFGILTCEQNDSGFLYQWDHPNGWPPLQIVAMDSLHKYGYPDKAKRIAQKYVDTVLRSFEKTGDIWEKYNVIDGSVEVKDEYQMPAMMGWSAAAFVVALDYLKK